MWAAFHYRFISEANMQLHVTLRRTKERFEAWQRDAWAAIKASAQAHYQEKLARLQEERDVLWRLLNGKDTLSLRRLEREELMRLVIQWLLGPAYPVTSTEEVQTTVGQLLQNENNFQTSRTGLFSMSDFIDLPTFVAKLTNRQDPGDRISKFLLDEFSPSTQIVLLQDPPFPPEKQKSALVFSLNKILEGASIYEEERFNRVTLSQETKELMSQNPKGKDLIRLNRLLLETAYPREIAKNPDPISPTFTGISEPKWYNALIFGEFVKFMHQAVEWENLLYFLYRTSGALKRLAATNYSSSIVTRSINASFAPVTCASFYLCGQASNRNSHILSRQERFQVN